VQKFEYPIQKVKGDGGSRFFKNYGTFTALYDFIFKKTGLSNSCHQDPRPDVFM
jgi:hypothetical protein